MRPSHQLAPPRWHPRGFNNSMIVAATFRGVSLLPGWLSYPIGHVGTRIAFQCQTTGREALISNLRVILPDASDAVLRRMALATYRSYARDVIDFIRHGSRSAEDLRRLIGRFDVAAFDRAVSAGRGVLAVSAHFGNWELGGVLLRRLTPHALSIVVMRERSEEVTRRRTAFRETLGIETIEIRRGMETALRIREHLAQNRIVAVLADRHVGRDRVDVEFFGRRAYFLRSPALLASLTGAPLVPIAIFRGDDGRLGVESADAIEVASGREPDIREATQRVAAFFEARIKRHPECWYQFYPYWASQDGAVDPRT